MILQQTEFLVPIGEDLELRDSTEEESVVTVELGMAIVICLQTGICVFIYVMNRCTSH